MAYGTQAFLANPTGFMNGNIVVPANDQIGNTQATAGILTLCLVSTACVGSQMGQDRPVYMLKKKGAADPPADSFDAYWAPYAQNETFTCMLGMTSPYMFTATMDGCSFGVGSQVGGVCRVAHSNLGRYGAKMEGTFGTEGAQTLQKAAQENTILHLIGNDAEVINPADYMLDVDGARALKSTTFGLRGADQVWRFYTQRYWRNGNRFFLREVTHQV